KVNERAGPGAHPVLAGDRPLSRSSLGQIDDAKEALVACENAQKIRSELKSIKPRLPSCKGENADGPVCRAAVVLVWSAAAAYTVFRLVEMVLTEPSDASTSGSAAASASISAASLLASSARLGTSSASSAAAAASAAVAEASSLEEPEFPAVTLCNINPAKGSELVRLNTAQYNVSNAYESLVDFITHKSSLQSSFIPIKKIFQETGHTIADMLKGCQLSNKRQCNEYNFEHSTTILGQCYTLHPSSLSNLNSIQPHGLRERENSEVTSLKVLLDPQGYDYLLPNEGFVGVTVIIHSPFEPVVVNLDQSLQVGPKFHTTVHVTASSKVNPAPCSNRATWKSCVEKCFASALLSKCKCAIIDLPYCTLNDLARCGIDISENPGINWLSKCSCGKPCVESDYRIQSVVQTPRSSLLSRLQTIKERDALARNTDMVEDANLVQQWAFLRETNRTAFATLSRLSAILSRFSSKFAETVHGLRRMAVTWHVRYVQNQHYGSQCANIVIEISEALSNMRQKAQEVREFSGSLFFETSFNYPNDDFLFRVVNLFFKYSPENIRAEFDLFDLTRFYQDLTAFEISFDKFKVAKCNSLENGGGAAGDQHRSLMQEDSAIKILLSDLQSLSLEFLRIFTDIYSNNEAIRQAYPSSRSKIKQTASPNSGGSQPQSKQKKSGPASRRHGSRRSDRRGGGGGTRRLLKTNRQKQLRQQKRQRKAARKTAKLRCTDSQTAVRAEDAKSAHCGQNCADAGTGSSVVPHHQHLSISLFFTLVVHLLSRLRCRPKSKLQPPKGESSAGTCELHQRSLRG
uniref:Amiloride-sensitive sodium channel n=1 Tax=Macrostomum lignano TaxID=282301 RepID=A0A1I8G4G9_9PLAT